jgi:hypothetical protein
VGERGFGIGCSYSFRMRCENKYTVTVTVTVTVNWCHGGLPEPHTVMMMSNPRLGGTTAKGGGGRSEGFFNP